MIDTLIEDGKGDDDHGGIVQALEKKNCVEIRRL